MMYCKARMARLHKMNCLAGEKKENLKISGC